MASAASQEWQHGHLLLSAPSFSVDVAVGVALICLRPLSARSDRTRTDACGSGPTQTRADDQRETNFDESRLSKRQAQSQKGMDSHQWRVSHMSSTAERGEGRHGPVGTLP